jgi:hypothetical protein
MEPQPGGGGHIDQIAARGQHTALADCRGGGPLAMTGFVLRAVIAAFGLWLATRWIDGFVIDELLTLLIAAALLGVINAFIRPVLLVLTLPMQRFWTGRATGGALWGSTRMWWSPWICGLAWRPQKRTSDGR